MEAPAPRNMSSCFDMSWDIAWICSRTMASIADDASDVTGANAIGGAADELRRLPVGFGCSRRRIGLGGGCRRVCGRKCLGREIGIDIGRKSVKCRFPIEQLAKRDFQSEAGLQALRYLGKEERIEAHLEKRGRAIGPGDL